MRARVIVSLLFVFGVHSAVAQTPAPFPSGAETRQAQFLKQLGPETRDWIRKEAAREADMRDVTEATAAAAIRSNTKFHNLATSDIEALTFIVMMEAAKSAQEDLRAIMDQVKQINDAKAESRKTMAPKRAGAPVARSAESPRPVATARPIKPVGVNQATLSLRPRPKADLDAAIKKAKDNQDSLNELGETESLRLQMAMDRMSKMMSTLSNLLKKVSDTSAGITQNLK